MTNSTPPQGEAIELLPPFQDRVQPWMMACFGSEIAADKLERNDRFIEEALELVQACGYDRSRAHALVDYVFGRPVGEPHQEVGGVQVTLAALCLAQGLDMHRAGEDELARINVPEIISKIRAKQAAKPCGSALPIPTPSGEALETERRILAVEMAAVRDVREAMQPFVALIDRIEGFMGWGDARNAQGERLKDDKTYVAAYLAARDDRYANKAISTEETREARITREPSEARQYISPDLAEVAGLVAAMHTKWMQREELMRQQGGFALIEQMANLLDGIVEAVPELQRKLVATIANAPTDASPLPSGEEGERARALEEAAKTVEEMTAFKKSTGDEIALLRTCGRNIAAAIRALTRAGGGS